LGSDVDKKDDSSDIVRIGSKIVSFSVVSKRGASDPAAVSDADMEIDSLRTEIARLKSRELLTVEDGDVLSGKRYKIPASSSYGEAYYVIINDAVLPDGCLRPYEMFIESKSPNNAQWIKALTRVISSVFRSQPDVGFIATELGEIFDPRGGYYRKGGIYVPSLVAEIGKKLKEHIKWVEGYNARLYSPAKEVPSPEDIIEEDVDIDETIFKNATFCPKCMAKTLVKASGCETCMGEDCDYEKCSG